MTLSYPLRLFAGYGLELEFMIVLEATLDVAPMADRLLFTVAGEPTGDVELGEIAWSNEIVLHVLEMKTNGPSAALSGLDRLFQDSVDRANAVLAPLGATLLPSGMHPWMDPLRETRLWPHEYNEVYQAYDRIFGARGHGWANLQSAHLNLPFGDEGEFVRLHAAVRVVLPLIPALAASSPVVEGRVTGLLDSRLEVYRQNQRRVPSIAGRVIPEPVRSVGEYHERILRPIYRDIAPLDPEGILQHEWLNSRGAIARFDRGAVEIRLVDTQECPRADLAVAVAIVDAVRGLAEERFVPVAELHRIPVEPLERILLDAIRRGEDATVGEGAVLRAFGLPAGHPVRAGHLWKHLAGGSRAGEIAGDALSTILGQGTLATRLCRLLGDRPGRERLSAVYRRLQECLARGEMLHAA
jgi:gamma-glutamyl:cysteine ligase YbdK (ATP-grasp superfamily)